MSKTFKPKPLVLTDDTHLAEVPWTAAMQRKRDFLSLLPYREFDEWWHRLISSIPPTAVNDWFVDLKEIRSIAYELYFTVRIEPKENPGGLTLLMEFWVLIITRATPKRNDPTRQAVNAVHMWLALVGPARSGMEDSEPTPAGMAGTLDRWLHSFFYSRWEDFQKLRIPGDSTPAGRVN
jgi:hypothetical protein